MVHTAAVSTDSTRVHSCSRWRWNSQPENLQQIRCLLLFSWSHADDGVDYRISNRPGVLDDFRSLELVRDGRRKTIKKAQDKGWSAEWSAFEKAIRAGTGPTIPYDHLIGVTKATFAALESLRSGERVQVS